MTPGANVRTVLPALCYLMMMMVMMLLRHYWALCWSM